MMNSILIKGRESSELVLLERAFAREAHKGNLLVALSRLL